MEDQYRKGSRRGQRKSVLIPGWRSLGNQNQLPQNNNYLGKPFLYTWIYLDMNRGGHAIGLNQHRTRIYDGIGPMLQDFADH